VTVETVDDAHALAPLAGAWNALAEPFQHPCLTFEWFEACARASAPEARPCIVVVRGGGGEVRAIAPLVRVRRNGSRALEILGNPLCNLCEPGGLLYRDQASLRTLVEAMLEFRLPLRLDRLPAGSPESGLLGNIGGVLMSVRPRRTRSLYLPVDGTWSAFEARLGSKRRSDLRRARKLAEQFGAVWFDAVRLTSDNVHDHLQELFALEASGWKGREGTAILTNPFQRKFWTRFADHAAGDGNLVLFVMRINGETAALRLAVEHASRLWEFKIAYDERFRRCFPGVLLTRETLRYVFERELAGHEFLGGEEGWERSWSVDAHEYLSFRIYPRSIAGAWGLAGDSARFVVSRARPASVRSPAP
jgi:CelD/BcsL family acetyltransferase involved in cellulose biosynthesis